LGWRHPAGGGGRIRGAQWVVLYRGPYGGARALLEKLQSAELYNKLEIPEDRAIDSTEVVVSVPVPLLERAREVLG
jgi:hypothetical protein